MQATQMRNSPTNVTEVIIPGSGHWLMEEGTGGGEGAVGVFGQEVSVPGLAIRRGLVLVRR